METVRAVITIGENSIQLEGPQEFVEKYLEQYKFLASGTQKTTKPSERAPETTREETDTTKKRKVRIKTGPSCTEKIRELITNGYFREPRTRADVQGQLLNEGTRFESKDASATLINFFNGGELRRKGVGKDAQYYSNI